MATDPLLIDHKACVLYKPGHHIHYIQASKSWEPGQPDLAVSVALGDDGYLELRNADLHETMWTHSPDRLGRLLYRGLRARWLPRYHVLSVNGSKFCLARPDQRTACVPDSDHLPVHAEETAPQRAYRHARERGGFTVPLDPMVDGR